VLKVRLYRPFDVNDRGSSSGERQGDFRARPRKSRKRRRALYLIGVNALHETGRSGLRIVGRYGCLERFPGDDWLRWTTSQGPSRKPFYRRHPDDLSAGLDLMRVFP
jgi:hypothetical protein